MASIEISNVRKAYGNLEVLHGVTIDIADGEFLVLVGPSGCGKSTLLRMIAGLENISGGDIQIGGRVVNDLPPKTRDIAMVFQSYALYPHMTVARNMAFSLKVARRSKAEIDQKVAYAADILGLTPLLSRRPSELSGGQRQRVAMGRAIVRDPAVFLFDEPLSNLDAQLRVQMRAEIKSLHHRLKTTMVYVTHDQVEAMTMADRIVVMNEGNVEQVGAPLELFDRPANLFVARFIGSPAMNLVEGDVVRRDGALVFIGENLEVDLAAAEGKVTEGRIVLGFRPEHVSLAAGPGMGRLQAEVVVVEPTGTETLLNLRVGTKQILATFRERLDLSPGSILTLGVDPHRIHLFDKASGNRVV
ncbi:MAG TPA: sn-glycerol-3-phosphate ABC transporter ATP-binding protein UgpC [Ramlibacter sp.]|jgi:multiple sugar transport system ATP-binding protein